MAQRSGLLHHRESIRRPLLAHLTVLLGLGSTSVPIHAMMTVPPSNGWLKTLVALLATLILGAYAFSYFAMTDLGKQMNLEIGVLRQESRQAMRELASKLDCLIDGRFCQR